MLRRHPELPPAGSALSVTLAAIPIVCDDCPDVFRRLLESMLRQLAARGERLFLIGLHARDPMLPILRQYAGREYLTTMHVVYWPDQAPDVDPLLIRVPYLELGSL
jgi:hypothetical protein